MLRDGVIAIAARLDLGPPAAVQPRTNWLHFKCPFAKWKHDSGTDRKPSFGIHIGPKRSAYWCFSCHSKGSLPKLAFELGRLRGVDYKEVAHDIERQELLNDDDEVYPEWGHRDAGDAGDDVLPKKLASLPDPYLRTVYMSAILHPYLIARGVNMLGSMYLDLRYDPTERRILFPIYTDYGAFAGFSGRATLPPSGVGSDGELVDHNGAPYLKVKDYLGLQKRKLFLNGQYLSQMAVPTATAPSSAYSPAFRLPRRSVLLVEGLIDVAVCISRGYHNAIGVLGTALTPEKLSLLKSYAPAVYLFFDGDVAGDIAKAEAVSALFGIVPLYDVRYPKLYRGADPASLPESVMHHMIRGAHFILDRSPYDEELDNFNLTQKSNETTM